MGGVVGVEISEHGGVSGVNENFGWEELRRRQVRLTHQSCDKESQHNNRPEEGGPSFLWRSVGVRL